MDLSLQQILKSVISEISESTQQVNGETLNEKKEESLSVNNNSQILSESVSQPSNSNVLTEETRRNILFSSALAAGAGALSLRKRIKENK